MSKYTYERNLYDGKVIWYRWTTTKGPDWDRMRVLNSLDLSPAASQYHPGTELAGGEESYDPKCGYCWLNGYHSSDYHRDRVKEAEVEEWRL